MPREILTPYSYSDESFPENPALPEGAREVRWQDSFGFGVAFRPDIVYAERDGEIAEVLVRAGDQIDAKDLLVVYSA